MRLTAVETGRMVGRCSWDWQDCDENENTVAGIRALCQGEMMVETVSRVKKCRLACEMASGAQGSCERGADELD